MSKKRALVVCPGRGSYTKKQLGYLKGFYESETLKTLDGLREKNNEPTIKSLDMAKNFRTNIHTKGENASSLIYACSLKDYLSINQNDIEITAVCGNSMGWYISLVMAGVLNTENGFQLINTMGSMMKDEIIGGQIIYPVVDDNWNFKKEKLDYVNFMLKQASEIPDTKVYVSIFLGGYLVLAGNDNGVKFLLRNLKPEGDYPFQLINHGAFHTPLLKSVSKKAFDLIPENCFEKPKIPLIDGRGHIWSPYSTNTENLYRYTLKEQVLYPYDFTTSITVALKEFAPDKIFLLGPGNSLGGVIGQILIKNKWQGLTCKTEFQELQKKDPFLVSMGL